MEVRLGSFECGDTLSTFPIGSYHQIGGFREIRDDDCKRCMASKGGPCNKILSVYGWCGDETSMDGTRRWLDVAKQGGDWYNCTHCSTSPVAADKAAADKAAADKAAAEKAAADKLAAEKAAADKLAAEKAAADKLAAEKAAADKLAAEKAAADKLAADKAAEQAKIDGIVNRYIARPRDQCYFTGTHAHQINLLQKPRYQDCVYECHENNLKNNREIECMGVVYSKDRYCYLNGFKPHVPDWATTGKLRCKYFDAEDSYLDDNAINRGWLNASDMRV
jgi:hypothetical protein